MLEYILLFLAGIVTGFLNVVAAGGSLISLPVLIFLGLPAPVANATNRVGILLQNITAVGSYYQEKQLDYSGGFRLMIPTLIGSLIGSYVAVDIDEDLFEKIIGVVLLVMLFSLFINPKAWLEEKTQQRKGFLSLKEWVVFLGIGLYGGFIQAGVGVFMLAGLVWASGYDLKRGNPIKVMIILSYTVVALGVFVYNDLVDWAAGINLALGSIIGARLGAKASIAGGSAFIRYVLIFAVLFSALKLLGVYDFLVTLLPI